MDNDNASASTPIAMTIHQSKKLTKYFTVESLPQTRAFLSMRMCYSIIYIIILTQIFCIKCELGGDVISDERYKLGKEKFHELDKLSRTMPKYGQCWVTALASLQVGCNQLSDDTQHRMALTFANCFLMRIGRGVYPCSSEQELAECTRDMSSDAYNTYLEFFTHTQNMCFFLRAQIWHDETERTIANLADNSAVVAQQLEASSELQVEIMKHQSKSIENQAELLQRGAELRTTLEDSSMNVHRMLEDFQNSTKEQKLLIFEVFDRVNSLQALVMGEFTGFYSFIFYTLSILISYLLTSTSRTNGARFWLFLLMTANITLERMLLWWHVSNDTTQSTQPSRTPEEMNNALYSYLWLCRKACSLLAILIWLWFAYRYQDYNRINNQLLVEIRKQNSDLKHLLQCSPKVGSDAHKRKKELSKSVSTIGQIVLPASTTTASIHGNTTGYESDTADDSDTSVHSCSPDHTFVLEKERSVQMDDSEIGGNTTNLCLDSTSSLLVELNSLRNASFQGFPPTPAKQENVAPQRKQSHSAKQAQKVTRSYNLRTRKTIVTENDAVRTETASQFGTIVKKLSKVASRNSRLTHLKEKRQMNNQPSFFSSDED